MGNYRFRLSDMIPNAWFYKLKDMGSRPRNHHKALHPTKKKHSPSSSSSSSLSLSSASSSVAVAAKHDASEIIEEPHLSDQRKSYYFTRDLAFQPNSPSKTRISDKQLPVEPPRKSSRRRRSTKRNRRPQPRLVSSTISAGCSCRATLDSVWTKPPDSSPEEEFANSSVDQTSSSDHDSILTEYGSDRGRTPETFDGLLSWSSPCKCRTENDIVIDMDDNDDDGDDDKPFNREFERVPELSHLPPIITKKQEPTKIQRTSAEFSERNAYGSLSVKVVKEDILTAGSRSSKDRHKTSTTSPVRRLSVNSSSPGVKLRVNSPRIANRRIQGRKSVSSNSSGGSRRSVSESFAVVKSSKDPRRDFRESMVEMIVENDIRASKDLEELLACYLSLNSNEYHDLIINVFKQIWFDFIHLRLK